MVDVLSVEVWSDIACPWCYLGRERLAEGVRRYAAAGGTAEVAITYRSFELAPDTPVDFEGSEVDFLSRHKGIEAAAARRMLDEMTERGAAEGLTYDFDRLRHTRTLLAHELLHLAAAHDVQDAMAERLFRAYFAEGRHVGRVDELADLAAEVGLDPDEVRTALGEHTYAAAVQADIDRARALGIGGVPCAVLDGRLAVSGAQSPDVFARALAQATSMED